MNNKYSNEVKSKWGNTSLYKEYEEKSKNYSKDKYDQLTNELFNIFKDFSFCMNSKLIASSNETLCLVEKLQNFISNNYYTCSNDTLLSLGNMYVCDERFKENIDKYSDGTAEYINEAIKYYVSK